MSPAEQQESPQLSRRGAPRLRMAVISGDGAALTFKIEVLGYEVTQIRTGRQALELPAAEFDAYLIENTLRDMSGSHVAELLRMDQSRARAWIFGIERSERVHRAVSHDTAVFDEVVVSPVDEATLRGMIERARGSRSAAAS